MWTKWRKTEMFRLWANLILQPQANPKSWIELHGRYQSVTFCELRKIPELNERMDKICIKIASEYCRMYENENEGSKTIPLPIKQIIGRVYLFIQPSLFKTPSNDDEQIEWQSEYGYQDLLNSVPKASVYEIVD